MSALRSGVEWKERRRMEEEDGKWLQYALGMVSSGSQIDRESGSITVRFDGASMLTFAGAPALWWIANAQAPGLRAWIDGVLVQIRAGAPSAIQTEPDITADNG